VRRCAARPLIHLARPLTFQCGPYATRWNILIMPALMQRARQQQWQDFHSQGSQARLFESADSLRRAGYGRHSLEIPAGNADCQPRTAAAKNSALMVGPQHAAYSSGQLSLQDYVDSAHGAVTLPNASAACRIRPGGFRVNQRRVRCTASIITPLPGGGRHRFICDQRANLRTPGLAPASMAIGCCRALPAELSRCALLLA